MSKRKTTSDGDSPGVVFSPPKTKRVKFDIPQEPIGKMVKRRRGTRYPISDARAAAHEAAILNQWNPAKARGSEFSVERYGHTMQSATPEQRYNRKLDGFKGRGDYASWKPWLKRWVPKGTLAALGGAAGGLFGHSALGSSLGATAAGYLGWGKYRRRRKNYRGRGDYGGSAGGNQIMAGSVDTPITVNASDDLSGDIYISHREFLGNVTATATGTTTPSGFNSVVYPINVGIHSSFPWLSQIAQNFTMYELHGLLYEYVPTSGELGSASNALGKVIMATQYDPDAAAFPNAIVMENYDYSNACKPSQGMIHGVETANDARATKMLYVRPGNGSSTKDRVFTDIGFFQISTEGLPLNATAGTIVNIGELWVTYRVRLSRAQLFGSLVGNSTLADAFLAWKGATTIASSTLLTLPSTPYAASYDQTGLSNGNSFAPMLDNSIGCTVTASGLNDFIIRWPTNQSTGLYLVEVYIIQLAAYVASRLTPKNATNCDMVVPPGQSWNGTVTPWIGSPCLVDAAQQVLSLSVYVQLNAPGTLQASLQVTQETNTLVNGSQLFVRISQIPMNLL